MLIFDIETDGLLPTLTKIHCIVCLDPATLEGHRFHGGDIPQGLELLKNQDTICGHNIINFDLPALRKVYGFEYSGEVTDTLIMSRLIYGDLADKDHRGARTGFPKRLIGSHSLKAWGYRLGEKKGTYAEDAGDGCWAEWSQEMEDYCEQDVIVTWKLWLRLVQKGCNQDALRLEHRFAECIRMQEERGVFFDEEGARKLYLEIAAKRDVVGRELVEEFGSWEVPQPDFIPKRDNATKGYKAGVPVRRAKVVVFNPGSRQHIARVLKHRHKWKQTEFTDSGQPKVDEAVLSVLNYPEVPKLLEYLLLTKRVGQLSEGNEGWLKHVTHGRIHGSVNTLGAVTRRCTHSHPNLAQVPKVGSPYGKECRELFKASPGMVMVGADASGLELRCLAHYMAAWDGGKYASAVVEGNKEDGTDAHSINAKAFGLSRDEGKTKFYGMIYGCGDPLLGDGDEKLGKKRRRDFESGLPAFGKLVAAVKKKAKTTGYLRSIDGQPLPVRSLHSSLNTLLQSCGAIICKLWRVEIDEEAKRLGLVPGVNYFPLLAVHDEYEFECLPEVAPTLIEVCEQSIKTVGERLKFRCPLAAEARQGLTWADVH